MKPAEREELIKFARSGVYLRSGVDEGAQSTFGIVGRILVVRG